jgi:hypothetical protein
MMRLDLSGTPTSQHAHLSFGNAVASTDLGDLPPEEHTLLTARNAKTLLDHGFTSAYSAASAKLRLDIVIRNAIAAGQIPGPRLKACGPEITVTGGLGDERSAHMYRDSFAVIADGPAEIVKWARLCCREGAGSIKLNVSGDNLYRAAQAEMTVMRDFRDFVFTNPVEFWGGMNPDFFKGTRVEKEAAAALADADKDQFAPRAAK